MAPDRVFRDGEAEEVILPTTTGQIGILENHTPLVTGLDMGIMLVREQGEWSALGLFRGFAFIQDNTVTILVNEVEVPANVNADEAQQALTEAQAELAKADNPKEKYLKGVQAQRARVRYQLTQVLQG